MDQLEMTAPEGKLQPRRDWLPNGLPITLQVLSKEIGNMFDPQITEGDRESREKAKRQPLTPDDRVYEGWLTLVYVDGEVLPWVVVVDHNDRNRLKGKHIAFFEDHEEILIRDAKGAIMKLSELQKRLETQAT